MYVAGRRRGEYGAGAVRVQRRGIAAANEKDGERGEAPASLDGPGRGGEEYRR